MARIAGVNIPDNKRIEIGLTYIFGIGHSTALKILAETGVDPGIQGKDLTEDETIKLRDAVEGREVEGDLRRERSLNVKRLMEIGSYRGLRHRRGLPVRGQRTKTNARGGKGPGRVDIDGKEIAWESAGSARFKGSRKSTPFAAQVTADAAAKKGMEHGLERVEVFAKGAGSGRETAIRSLQAAGLDVTTVKDVSRQAHNGCRPKKRRRV